ncbi:MAG: hypothetical protein CSA54_03655 [Gammaproteobacteria bacterium]|nr:MAG: hypothetical protein CSA54_03655 [Gammaproteobacteria bacterium]
MSGQGLPGPDLLVRLLDETDKMPVARMAPVSLDEPVWRSPSGRMNPIVAGAALSDAAAQVRERGGIEIDKLCLPLLLAPALAAAAAQAGSPLAASWQGVRLTSDGWRVACDGDDAALLTEMAERVLVTTDAAAPVSFPEVVSRATVPQDVLNTLARFAHRTYAPATEESRARGAGTGDSDND